MGRQDIALSFNYIAKLFCQESEVQKSITDAIAHKRKMQLSPIEGRLIFLMLKMIAAKNVIEIGTLGGYSASWIADALPDNGVLYALEKSAKNLQIAKSHLKGQRYLNKIKFIEGDATSSLESFVQEASFDAVFIDADKISYPIYFRHAKRLLRKGGLLIADNTLLFGLVLNDEAPAHNPQMWSAMREFNETIANDPDFDALLIPTVEGMTIALKKL